jgi:SAM-dependent methyltransferase
MTDLPVALRAPLDDLGAAPYDRHAALYDRLIGARLYNRVVWGARVSDYAAFAAEAVAAGDGPLLDAGCGTAVFSAGAYRAATRPLVLVDRSTAMLARARERIGRDDDALWLVQGDLLALPFAEGAFATVACHAVLHVLDEPWAALDALAAQVGPGGGLFASMLVADGPGISPRYLRMLHGRGEAGPPRTSAELAEAARARLGDGARVERAGAMAYLRWRRPVG